MKFLIRRQNYVSVSSQFVISRSVAIGSKLTKMFNTVVVLIKLFGFEIDIDLKNLIG